MKRVLKKIAGKSVDRAETKKNMSYGYLWHNGILGPENEKCAELILRHIIFRKGFASVLKVLSWPKRKRKNNLFLVFQT